QTDRPYLPRQYMKASRRRIDSSRPLVCRGGAAGRQGKKARCGSFRRSVLLGFFPGTPLGF
ncbi:MAG: hypothetical protein ACRDOD_07540, partial [Streptosporangiaceae bacterium]